MKYYSSFISKIFFSLILSVCFLQIACSKAEEQKVVEESSPVYLRSEPAAGEVLERHPRTLRVYLSALPDIEKSSLTLTGENGEVSLSRFHTMGADDLMIEIDDHPLPNGNYSVSWSAVIEGDSSVHSGGFAFTVAVPEE
ncbi:copper resistance CopC family protein [Aurantivibrio infirmus]